MALFLDFCRQYNGFTTFLVKSLLFLQLFQKKLFPETKKVEKIERKVYIFGEILQNRCTVYRNLEKIGKIVGRLSHYGPFLDFCRQYNGFTIFLVKSLLFLQFFQEKWFPETKKVEKNEGKV